MKIFLSGEEVHHIVIEHLETRMGVRVLTTDTKMTADVTSVLSADGRVDVDMTLDGIEAVVEDREVL